MILKYIPSLVDLEDFPNSARDPLAHTVYEGAVINCGAPSHYPGVFERIDY